MKKIIFLIAIILTQNSFANLYLTTEYQETGNSPVITKQHIYLNKRYPVNYKKMAYTLTLTKMEKDRGTIETETFVVDSKGKKEFSAGGIANFTLGKPIVLEQFSKAGKREFILRIHPEKLVP